jgi:hypothetical protein
MKRDLLFADGLAKLINGIGTEARNGAGMKVGNDGALLRLEAVAAAKLRTQIRAQELRAKDR